MYHLYGKDVKVDYRDGHGFVVSGTPLFSLEKREELLVAAKAHLFDKPDETVTITEGERVLELMRNTAVDRISAEHSKLVSVLVFHLVFFAIFGVASILHGYGWMGGAILFATHLAYQVLWRLGFANEIESGVAVTIILIQALLICAKF